VPSGRDTPALTLAVVGVAFRMRGATGMEPDRATVRTSGVAHRDGVVPGAFLGTGVPA
jgi:hypothetical protein